MHHLGYLATSVTVVQSMHVHSRLLCGRFRVGFSFTSTSFLSLHVPIKNNCCNLKHLHWTSFNIFTATEMIPQIWIILHFQNQHDVTKLQHCIQDIKDWLAHNFLQLKVEVATEMILFGPSHHSTTIAENLSHLSINMRTHTKTLGIIFDLDPSFYRQVNSVVRHFLTPSDLVIDTLIELRL